MTSIDRAKQFLAKRASKLAMTIVPLALAAVPASAGVISGLQPGTPACHFGTAAATDSNKSCGTQATPDGPAVNPTLNALSLFGQDTVTGGAASGGGFGLTITFGGNAGGTFSGDVPVNYNFTISESNANDPITWSLQYDIGAFSKLFNGTGVGLQTGSGALTGPLSPTAISQWDAILIVSATSSLPGDTVTVNIPGGATININQAATTTPEPGSMLALGSGLAALLAFISRRKRQV